jgi:lipoprotein-anchoring transpeptidase ErfK/SrfK
MRHTVLRWVSSVGTIAVVGAVVAAQGPADAVPSAPQQSASVTSAAAYVPPKHDLFFGDTGAAVKSVQRRLNQLHYYAGPDDGVYGQDLEEAVWAFKEVQGQPIKINWNDLDNSGSTITWAFRKALVHPKAPKVLIKHGPADRVEVNQNIEVLVLYKNNKVRWILHVSSGGGYYFCNQGSCGYAVTPDGNFKAYYMNSGWYWSPLCGSAAGCMYNPVWVDPAAGVAIHGDPSVPWYPVSHGCIRIWMDAATWFYKDLTIGGKHPTPVYVRGTAPYQPSIVG